MHHGPSCCCTALQAGASLSVGSLPEPTADTSSTAVVALPRWLPRTCTLITSRCSVSRQVIAIQLGSLLKLTAACPKPALVCLNPAMLTPAPYAHALSGPHWLHAYCSSCLVHLQGGLGCRGESLASATAVYRRGSPSRRQSLGSPRWPDVSFKAAGCAWDAHSRASGPLPGAQLSCLVLT